MVHGIGSRISDLEFDDDIIIKAIDYMTKGRYPGPDTDPVELWKSFKYSIVHMLVPIYNNTIPCLSASFMRKWQKLVSFQNVKMELNQNPWMMQDLLHS